jgi:hypothetical protein
MSQDHDGDVGPIGFVVLAIAVAYAGFSLLAKLLSFLQEAASKLMWGVFKAGVTHLPLLIGLVPVGSLVSFLYHRNKLTLAAVKAFRDSITQTQAAHAAKVDRDIEFIETGLRSRMLDVEKRLKLLTAEPTAAVPARDIPPVPEDQKEVSETEMSESAVANPY